MTYEIRMSNGRTLISGVARAKYDGSEITMDDVQALKDEAEAAGDELQVALCTHALAGDSAAWERCEDTIRAARAMAD